MRQVITLAALLLVALVGSYLTWTADEGGGDTEKTDVMVYRADADDVSAMEWASDSEQVRLERRSDEHGDYVWVTYSEQVEVEPAGERPAEGADTDAPMGPDLPDADADTDADTEAPEPVTETRTVSFKGNEAADGLWQDFAPLHALRTLEADASDAGFGFDEPTGTLTVERDGNPLELVVGGETYGSRDRYVRYDGRVYLVDDRTLRPLQFAKTRLVERRLQPYAEPEIERIEVQAGDTSASFVHNNRDDRAASFWARADTPAEEDTAAETWLGKVLRMRVQDYATSDVDESALTEVFTYTAHGEDAAWTVTVLRADGGDDAPEYYARSTWDRALVHLTESLASEAVADVDAIVTE